MSIQDLHRDIGVTVSGQFRLSGWRERLKSDGRGYQVLQLDDASGTIRGMVWPGVLDAVAPIPAAPCVVELQVRPRWFNTELILDVQQLRKIEADEVELGAALLPRRLCPDIALRSLRDLVEFQQSLERPELKQFLTRVFCDPEITEGLLVCRASRKHHHSFEGGLLVHSVSPLALVKTMAEDHFHDDSDAIEVTQVGYLLHDLGKIRTLIQGHPPTALFLRHEFFTGQILGQHLDWLGRHWPSGAAALRYILDYVDQPRAGRRRATFLGADVVISVDQHNASLAIGRGLDFAEADACIEENFPPQQEVRHAAR